MAINITSPVTGSAQTGFTSPTYTLLDDQATSLTAKQKLVSATGGTQAGVSVHSISKPFIVAVSRPATFKTVGVPSVNGQLGAVGKNTFKVHVRKGVVPLSGQAPQMMLIDANIAIPAGADTADPAEIRAAISLFIGTLNQISASLGDSVIQGSI